MHKTTALLIGLTILSNSVLVPTTANAQTIATSSITASTTGQTGMTTTQGNPIQELNAPTYHVTLTSYNAVPGQTKADPFTTSIGVFSNPQVIAARSDDLASELPYGTIIEVDGPESTGGATCGYSNVQQLIGYRVIGDAMNARWTRPRIDILLDQNDTVPVGDQMVNPSVALGACTGVTIKVVGYVDPAHIPQTQAELAAIVNGSQHLASAQF